MQICYKDWVSGTLVPFSHGCLWGPDSWGKHPIAPVRLFQLKHTPMNGGLPSANWIINQFVIVLDGVEPGLNGNQPFESLRVQERMLHLSQYEGL